MSEIPMNERNIAFFPMQSVQIGMDEADNPIYDNAADAEILQKLRQLEIKDGIYPDDSTYLQVMSNDDMTVTVKAGYAHVRGVQVWIKEDATLALAAADALVDRVDRVVLRLDWVGREVTLEVKTGDTSLTRIEGQTWELGLADIAVDHLNDTVTQVEITDLRLDTNACGVVSGLMQVDTQSIFNQYMTWWADQQDTTGYLTVAGDNPSLNTTDKKVLGAINELQALNSGMRYEMSADQLIGGGMEYVDFGNEIYSFGENHPTRTGVNEYTINATGIYRITAGVTFQSNADGMRRVFIGYYDSNGNSLGIRIERYEDAFAGDNTYINLTTEDRLEAGNIIKVGAKQTSGISLNLVAERATFLCISRIY